MKRRALLKNLILGTTAAIALPAWAKNWTPANLPEARFLSDENELILTELIDTLIPKTDTPGAVELGVPAYVQAMLSAMHTAEEQQAFQTKLLDVNDLADQHYGAVFSSLSTEQKLACLNLMAAEDESWKTFFNTFKRYSVQGYTGSEWYMTTQTDYEYAPGYGHGCVDL